MDLLLTCLDLTCRITWPVVCWKALHASLEKKACCYTPACSFPFIRFFSGPKSLAASHALPMQRHECRNSISLKLSSQPTLGDETCRYPSVLSFQPFCSLSQIWLDSVCILAASQYARMSDWIDHLHMDCSLLPWTPASHVISAWTLSTGNAWMQRHGKQYLLWIYVKQHCKQPF